MDNIFGERFAGFRKPGWHNIGTVFTEPITAQEAVKLARLDYLVERIPLTGRIDTPFGTQLVTVEGKCMIVRQPTPDDNEWRYFGIASENYGIIQNMEIASSLDRLTSDWPVETVGALGKGETIFITLDAGETEIITKHGGVDKLHQYFLVTDTKDGGTSLKIAFTPVRVVCQNTLITGLNQATVSTAITHKTDVGATFDFRVDLVAKLQKAKSMTMDAFTTMANTAITQDQARQIINAAYPFPARPKKISLLAEYANATPEELGLLGGLFMDAVKANEAYEYACGRVKTFQAQTLGLFDRICDEYPNIAMTPYAAYNAVVESADYRNGDDDSIAISALFGTRAIEKKHAFATAQTFIE